MRRARSGAPGTLGGAGPRAARHRRRTAPEDSGRPGGGRCGEDARISVSVAIPTLDGGAAFERVLTAVRAQTVEAELVVLDSGSADGTVAAARAAGAAVHSIEDFGHGRARNRLMELAHGDRVAFLTQD